MEDLEISSDEYSVLILSFIGQFMKPPRLDYTLNLTKQLWDYLNYVGNPDNLFSQERKKAITNGALDDLLYPQREGW